MARVEKQTFVCTQRKEDAVPTPAPRVESMLGNWKDPQEMDKEMGEKFNGSMTGEPPHLAFSSVCVCLCVWRPSTSLNTGIKVCTFFTGSVKCLSRNTS